MAVSHLDALHAATVEVLEQFVFMIGEPVGWRQAPVAGGGWARAHMMIKGPDEVALRVAAPLELCKKFAGNALGVEEDRVDKGAGEDSLKEFLNIVCGKYAALLFGETALVDLTPPLAGGIGPEQWDEMGRDKNSVCFDVEGLPLIANYAVLSGHATA